MRRDFSANIRSLFVASRSPTKKIVRRSFDDILKTAVPKDQFEIVP